MTETALSPILGFDPDGDLVLPGFVDAHAHVTETGLLLAGLDLTAARSVTEVLDLVAAAARARPGARLLGHGWDELVLAEGRPPTGAELDRAGGGGEIYLSRVDVHSAVVSAALADRAGLRALAGWDDTGRVERDAHHAARHVTRFGLTPPERDRVHRLALTAAAAAGLSEVHEMSAQHIAPEIDLAELVALSAAGSGGRPLPVVVPYRGELVDDEAGARAVVERLRDCGLSGPGGGRLLVGLAGDLNVDGSFGSRTAALRADYSDAPGRRGHLYLDADQVRDHVVACTRAGLQAGFHVIGDAAVDALRAGFTAAAGLLGVEAIRAGRHRLEHFESPDAEAVATAARLGLTASVQPAFDAAWGGPQRMYARRLGPDRAARLNPLADLAAAGVRLAFGSDSPVTPFAPWEGVRAAITHRTPQQRIGIVAALRAHTVDARAAGRAPTSRPDPTRGSTAGPGPVTGPVTSPTSSPNSSPGPATTVTVWRSPAIRAARRDPARALAGLADELAAGDPAPECVRTVVSGRVAFQAR